MKRIITLLLCFMLICPVFPNVSYASAADDGILRDLSILEYLEIVEDYDATSLDVSGRVKRGEFVNYVARLIKAESSSSNEVYYYDVPTGHYAFNAVSYLTETGVIRGTAEHMFHPEEDIILADACKILLSITGWDVIIEAKGGYPYGCIKVADQTDLTKGCKGGEYLAEEDMIKMLRNALTLEMNTVVSMSENEVEYKTYEDVNILSEYYDMYIDEGRITAANPASIFASGSGNENSVTINDVVYYDEEGLGYELLGEEVEFIYHEDKDDIKTLKWIYSIEEKYLEIFAQETDCTFDNDAYTLTYYPENAKKAQTAELDRSLSIIKNGEFYTGKTEDIFNEFVYKIKLIASDGGDYDIMRVNTYYDMKVSVVDAQTRTVYGTEGEVLDLDPANFDKLEILNVAGTAVNFTDISADNILSIMKADSGRVLRIYISNSVISGTVTKINSTDKTFEIDGKNYKPYKAELIDEIKAGDVISAYMDAFSYITEVKMEKTSGQAAYLINAVITDTGLSQNLSFKILNEKGKVAYHEAAERVRVNNVNYDNPKDVYAILCPNKKVNNQLFICTINADNKISRIDTVNDGNIDGLHTFVQKGSMLYNSGSKKFGTKVVVGANTIMFAVPDKDAILTADDIDFGIKKANNLTNSNYTVTAYKRDDSDGAADYIVIDGADWNTPSEGSLCVLVSSVEESLNDDEAVTELLEGFQGSVPVHLYAREGYSIMGEGVGEGDIVRVSVNVKGEVTKVNTIYKYGSTDLRVDTGIGAAKRMVMGYAGSKLGNIVNIGYTGGEVFDEAFDLTGITFTVVDTDARNDKVRSGSISDIVTYKNAKDECSLLFIEAGYGYTNHVIVYK